MVSYRFDRYGRLTGYTKSTADDNDNGVGLLIVVAIMLVPFAPIILASYDIFIYARNVWEIHPLFCGIIAVAPTLLILVVLVKSRLARYAYFGSESIALALYVFYYSYGRTDIVWACFFSLIALVIGFFLTHLIANLGLDD